MVGRAWSVVRDWLASFTANTCNTYYLGEPLGFVVFFIDVSISEKGVIFMYILCVVPSWRKDYFYIASFLSDVNISGVLRRKVRHREYLYTLYGTL